MSLPEMEREQQALDWVRRITDPDFSAWDAHLQWLEDDPCNAETFDRVSLEMEGATSRLPAAGPTPPAPLVANDNHAAGKRRHWAIGTWVSGSIAAIAAALLLWPRPDVGGARLIATSPGVPRDIALADGTKIALNGAGRMRIDNDRSIALLDGEAFFEVRHHSDHPFRLQVGGRVIQDVGTAFDVSISPGSTRVSVREGAVAIDPEAENIRLAAGQEARIGVDGEIIRTSVQQGSAIGGWRDGRLVYQGASWTDVVIDLSRALGVSVTADPRMADRRFTGVIFLDRDRSRTIQRVANVAGLSASRKGEGWLLTPR
ncbi:FecR domain-containing protein [Sphingomonas sp. CGMCC 1.13654]|uniref:FecR domain-containing protein n=1 Tax=Sphingomonas chungangi TaxID=2683589 RepID=A0A838KZ57_9SPHN|nr:FecR domain-containing protein [Sphingomonas chungangi]MBA2932553.1 FecR domain-containing protein [Sphingomonas chungangi]MVW56176.1 iron dicitrate transport regulator FecR [Sphingomonas chungangi]